MYVAYKIIGRHGSEFGVDQFDEHYYNVARDIEQDECDNFLDVLDEDGLSGPVIAILGAIVMGEAIGGVSFYDSEYDCCSVYGLGHDEHEAFAAYNVALTNASDEIERLQTPRF